MRQVIASATMQPRNETSRLGPSFHGPDRPDAEQILDCVHCGLCLPACPTYLTTGIEMSSPRGRIYMMRAVEEGRAGIGAVFVKHLDQCLGCLACQTACPSGVPYGALVESARAQIEQQYDRASGDRRWRRFLLWLFPYPDRIGPALRALSWYQRLGISRLVRMSGLLDLLSPRLARMESLLPRVPSARARRPLPETTRAHGRRLGRIGLLTGCVQRYLLPEINRSTLRVLSEVGYEVIVPPLQGCCGAMHLHTGDLETGRSMARAMIETFECAGVDSVVSNAAGCGAAMKSYGTLLREDRNWRERAEAFSGRVRDVSEILAGVTWNGELRPVPLAVTYHEACHLAHAQGIRREPRVVLERIPQLTLVDLPESDLCCGSAGVYNLLQTELADQLLARKVERIRETGASHVAIGNIGCLLQITLGLRRAALPVRAVHPVELVDWALHGMPAPE